MISNEAIDVTDKSCLQRTQDLGLQLAQLERVKFYVRKGTEGVVLAADELFALGHQHSMKLGALKEELGSRKGEH